MKLQVYPKDRPGTMKEYVTGGYEIAGSFIIFDVLFEKEKEKGQTCKRFILPAESIRYIRVEDY